MATLATTRMSSKGQIVIPEEIRDRLGLQSGTQFVVLGDPGTLLKIDTFHESLGVVSTLLTG